MGGNGDGRGEEEEKGKNIKRIIGVKSTVEGQKLDDS